MIPNGALLLDTRNQPRLSEAPELQKLVTITNRVAAKLNGSRDTCILTSFALNDTLQRLGYNSRPLRIEAAVFPDDQKLCGTILGGWREPGRRRAASPTATARALCYGAPC
jgi:hypothetical protein